MALDDGTGGEHGFTLRFVLAGLIVIAVQAALAVQAFPGAAWMSRRPLATLVLYASFGVLLAAVFGVVQFASQAASGRGVDGTTALLTSAAMMQIPQVLMVVTRSSIDPPWLVAAWWIGAAILFKRVTGLAFFRSLGLALLLLVLLGVVATGSGFMGGRR
jgi:hypothetical protein